MAVPLRQGGGKGPAVKEKPLRTLILKKCRRPLSSKGGGRKAVIWIRIIRSDPHHFGLPDPGSKKSAKIMETRIRTDRNHYQIFKHCNYTFV